MPKKLLVADKSVVIQKSVGITFAQEEFTVTYVSDGEDALNKARQLKPDILLVHINTPKMTGYEVCEAIRKDPSISATPVLFLVGTHEALDEAKAKAAAVNGFIMKPFESQALIDKVKELTSQKPAPAITPPAPKPAAPPPPPAPASRAAAPPPPPPPPTATIAGQSPLSAFPPPPPPPPMATIAGQAPIKRDVPMLDLEVPEPQVASPIEPAGSFDFSLDDSMTSEPQTDTIELSPPQAHSPTPDTAAQKESASDVKESNEFWDMSDSLAEEAPISPSPSPPSPMPPASSVFGASETTEFPLDMPSDAPTIELDLSQPTPESPSMAIDVSPEPEAGLELEVGGFEDKTKGNGHSGIELSNTQIESIVSKVFEKVIERIAWEVVPDLAEKIIREELKRLTQDTK